VVWYRRWSPQASGWQRMHIRRCQSRLWSPRGSTIVAVFLRASRPLCSNLFSGPSCERPEDVRSRDIDAGASSLPIKERVDYKLCCHVHNVSIGHTPAYISDMLTTCADDPSFFRVRTSSSNDYVVPRTRRTKSHHVKLC